MVHQRSLKRAICPRRRITANILGTIHSYLAKDFVLVHSVIRAPRAALRH
jgi:hypothetical protein